MSRLFFVDSENVGDNWTLMLDTVSPDDEILVFYTRHSPHMSYGNLIHLKKSPKDVSFIECFEGANALDFELVSELGYQLALSAGDEYVIVSNDNGFEAVVKYWKRKGAPVRRIPGKACANIRKEGEEPQVECAQDGQEEPQREKKAFRSSKREEIVSGDAKETLSSDRAGEGAYTVTDDAKEILFCVGRENLANLHEALMQLYGSDKCKFLYNTFKTDPVYGDFIAKHEPLGAEERQLKYCRTAFALQDPEAECPDDFAAAVMKSRKGKKNLNSLRAALQSRYGKENGLKYYSLIKPHVKVLDNII